MLSHSPMLNKSPHTSALGTAAAYKAAIIALSPGTRTLVGSLVQKTQSRQVRTVKHSMAALLAVLKKKTSNQ